MEIRLEHLTKIYMSRNRKGEQVRAANDLNFTIPDGKLVGLLGPSGCGKSTALNLICGLETPTNGKIYFGETDVTEIPSERRGVGLVFQNYALYPHLTVRENILFPLQNLKGDERPSKEEMESKVKEVARLVQIEELMHRKPSDMSGGQQQRVAIARALVKMPQVLLMDEPLSNLDARLRLQTREEIRTIQKKTGITTVFVTHDQEEAMSISDMIVVMKEGTVHQIGKPQEVYDMPANMFVAQFLGTPQINTFEGTVKSGRLYIDDDVVMTDKSLPEGNCYVGIRPEGFMVKKDGAMECDLVGIEVMGRDTSVISRHRGMKGESIRSIIPVSSAREIEGEKVRFTLNKEKVYLFSTETEELIWNGRI